MGKTGVFDKHQLIEHVNKMDDIGKQILNLELQFMKALSEGEITDALTSIQNA